MTSTTPPGEVQTDLSGLPESIEVRRVGRVALVRLCRSHKRNALDDATVVGIGRLFAHPPSWATAAVLDADGDHFCAGLDLSSLDAHDALQAMQHSRMWHEAFDRVERGTLPVVSVLKGAVVGGGLELASATHVRVAEPSTFFALPEGQRGLFVGGGGSVRIPRLVGSHRMVDMMLTGRVYDATSGHDVGFCQYLVQEGAGLQHALDLAAKIAGNAPLSNLAVLQALPRIGESSHDNGLFLESLMASMASSSEDAQQRMAEFIAGRAAKVTR